MTCQERKKSQSLWNLLSPCVLGVSIAPNSAPQEGFPAGGHGGCHAPVSPQTNGAVIPQILSYKIITALFYPFYSIESSYHGGTETSSSLQACTDAFILSLSPCCPPSGHFQVLRSVSIPGPPCSVQPCSCRGTVCLQTWLHIVH